MSEVSVLGKQIVTKVKNLDGCNNSPLVKRSFEICNNVLDLCNDCYDEFEELYNKLNNSIKEKKIKGK